MHYSHGWLEIEGQEGAGKHENDEAVERHLTEHEAPVVWEDLSTESLDYRANSNTLV